MGVELRCINGIKFGEIFGKLPEATEGFLEFKCRSKRCGARPGVVVIHRFSFQGKIVATQQFRDPAFREEVKNNATRNSTSLRSA